jgi:hypothetical protein
MKKSNGFFGNLSLAWSIALRTGYHWGKNGGIVDDKPKQEFTDACEAIYNEGVKFGMHYMEGQIRLARKYMNEGKFKEVCDALLSQKRK